MVLSHLVAYFNTTSFSYSLDSTPPRIKFGKSSHPTQFNTRVNLPLLSNEFANFNCSLDDRPYTPCGAGLTGRFVANRLTEGPHELKVKATDKAGNEAKPISLKWNSGKLNFPVKNVLPQSQKL
jgi:hypothetical protein